MAAAISLVNGSQIPPYHERLSCFSFTSTCPLFPLRLSFITRAQSHNINLLAMDSLPRELLESILIFNVQMCRCNKNNIFPLRLVCKAFDAFLKPYIFKTIQLEFSKFMRHAPTHDFKSLDTVGKLCQAMYLDMMVVRDEGMLVSAELQEKTILVAGFHADHPCPQMRSPD